MRFSIHTDCECCGRMIKQTSERKKLYDLYKIEKEYCVFCINKRSWGYRK